MLAELRWSMKIPYVMEFPLAVKEDSCSVSPELTEVYIRYRTETGYSPDLWAEWRFAARPQFRERRRRQGSSVAASRAELAPAGSQLTSVAAGSNYSHNPPLVTTLPSDDTIRRLSRLSTRIGHIARLCTNPRAFTTSCRQQGGSSAMRPHESPDLLLWPCHQSETR